MRTLKKTLCLVLVLAMALSFCTVAFAAKNLGDYVDAADAVRPYEEAVDTLVGVGLIAGVSDTELGLNEYVTREQAAKMIAYALVGEKSADAVSKQAVIFSDVEAGRWSAGYIGLCNELGIINGYSKDVFGPEDNVTGYQFAKMLLGMVGYGKNNEYTGEAWAVNAAKDAVALDIFKGILDSATDEPITRKEAFTMLFNAMTECYTVEYNKPFDTYYVTGTSVLAGELLGSYEDTLAYINFELEPVTLDDGDNYGRPAHYWTQDGEKITNAFSDVPDYTLTGKVTEDKLYDTLGKTVLGDTYTKTYIVDGKAADFPVVDNNDTTVIAGESSVTEIYVDKDEDVKTVLMITINNYFGKVADVEENSDEKLVAEITGYGELVAEELTKETAKFEKDDYVYFTGYWDGQNDDTFVIDTIAKADKTAATELTAVAGAYVKTADAKYTKAGKIVAEDGIDAKSKYDIYTDNYGNVIGLVLYSDAATNLNYLYVSDSEAKEYGLLSNEAYVKVAADFTDGTSDVIKLYVKNSKKASTASTPAQFKDITNNSVWVDIPAGKTDDIIPVGFYSYTVNADGLYTLKAIDEVEDAVANGWASAADPIAKAEYSATLTYGEGSAKLNIGTATSSTKLVIVEDQITYTGYKNFPEYDEYMTETSKVMYTLDKNNKLATIYVFGESDILSEEVYAVFDSYVEYDGEYYYYNLYVNGVKGEYKFETSIHDVASTENVDEGYAKRDIFVIETNAKGVSVESSATAGAYQLSGKTGVKTADADGYFYNALNNYFYYGDKTRDCEIYDFSGNTLKTASTVSKGDYVYIVYDKTAIASNEYVATFILIVDDGYEA